MAIARAALAWSEARKRFEADDWLSNHLERAPMLVKRLTPHSKARHDHDQNGLRLDDGDRATPRREQPRADQQLQPSTRWSFGRFARPRSWVVSSTGAFQRGRGGPGGWWILDEPELHLVELEPIVPDLAGWRIERMPTL